MRDTKSDLMEEEEEMSYAGERVYDDVGVGAFLFASMEVVQHPKNDLGMLKIYYPVLYVTYL